MRVLIYLVAYLILVGSHLLSASYPDGLWGDDALGYYASSARWLSATGPMEVGRRIMVDAFDPSAGNRYDREVARAVFNNADPYMGWAIVHGFLWRAFSLSPNTGFLLLQLIGGALYLLSLVIFIQTCLSELALHNPSDAVNAKRLTPLVVLLQVTYLGNALLVGPLLFKPAMFVLPLTLLFLGLLPRASFLWLRLILLCAIILIHSSGIILTMACLCSSFLYRAIGVGSQASLRERLGGFFKEAAVVGIFFALVIVAGWFQWIPSPYPLSTGDYRFGFDGLGARRVWRFVGMGLGAFALVVPLFFLTWSRSHRKLAPLPVVVITWITVAICSAGMLLLVQTWTVQQPALVRFMYTGWPLLLASSFLVLVWLASRPKQTWLSRLCVATAVLLLVVSNVRTGIRFQTAMLRGQEPNNCRFLFEPTQVEIRRFGNQPGGLVVVFSTRAGGLISFMAGAGDYPVYYSRLTPDWKERVHTDSRRFVLVVAPLMEYLNGTVTDPNEALQLDKDKWLIAWDLAVSRKGTLPIGGNGAAASLGQVARSLDQPGWGCDGRAGSVYRLTTYEQAALAKP